MSAPDISAVLESVERNGKEIAAAITTLGRLLPSGMSITVDHSLGSPAMVEVTYPDGTKTMKEFQGGALH